jgi:hypothetical protein
MILFRILRKKYCCQKLKKREKKKDLKESNDKPKFSSEFFNYSSIFKDNALKNKMLWIVLVTCKLRQKNKITKKKINIYTYTYIFEKPFDCIFAWKIKKINKTNPISIKQSHHI